MIQFARPGVIDPDERGLAATTAGKTIMHGVIPPNRLRIAVIGSGISGMSAAWLLSQRHEVTVYEREARVGGHAHTVSVRHEGRDIPVDTGFIVYNEGTYPNLTALFQHLDVPTVPSRMSFSVSLDNGGFEYAGGCGLAGLIAQKRNLLRGRYWAMLRDLARFYRQAPDDLPALARSEMTLGTYLGLHGYGEAFQRDHLLPMAAAIWSAPAAAILRFPAASFIRFFANHGLLHFRDRPEWRTVVGGSRTYIGRLTARFADRVRTGRGVRIIRRDPDAVRVEDAAGRIERYDHVVVATHADEALRLLGDPTPEERGLLGAFRYSRNLAVLHTDAALMPRRRAAWASWNHIGGEGDAPVAVTYWMNSLQPIAAEKSFFVTLNPAEMPRGALHTESYDHPVLDSAAVAAQAQLWSLQGRRNTWFCGAHFGAGFHEDGLQSGLAVAEALGGVRRPWLVPNENGRIVVGPAAVRPRGVARRMTPWSTLYTGSVIHRRLKPRRHRLRYRLFWLLLDLDEIDALARRLRVFSRNRFNLFAFHDRDFGDGSDTPLATQVRRRLASEGIETGSGRIALLTMPRILGHVFNPISVYFCRDEEEALRAIVYEVHNTFGERHAYVLPVEGPAGGTLGQHAMKAFHVSPFLGMDLCYGFRVHAPDQRVSVAISVEDADGPVMVAALAGERRPLTDRALGSMLAAYPLMTIKVVAAIHWHALRMVMQGFRVYRHPRNETPAERRMQVADTEVTSR